MTIFFKLDQNKINFKQFAVLNAFLLRKLISKNTSKNISNSNKFERLTLRDQKYIKDNIINFPFEEIYF